MQNWWPGVRCCLKGVEQWLVCSWPGVSWNYGFCLFVKYQDTHVGTRYVRWKTICWKKARHSLLWVQQIHQCFEHGGIFLNLKSFVRRDSVAKHFLCFRFELWTEKDLRIFREKIWVLKTNFFLWSTATGPEYLKDQYSESITVCLLLLCGNVWHYW